MCEGIEVGEKEQMDRREGSLLHLHPVGCRNRCLCEFVLFISQEIKASDVMSGGDIGFNDPSSIKPSNYEENTLLKKKKKTIF